MIVDDLITQVRNQIEESNTEDISDNDIITELNTSQTHAANILSRRYDEMMITSTSITTTAGTTDYDIPADAFADRIEKIEQQVPGSTNRFRRLKKVSIQRSSGITTSGNSSALDSYSVKKGKIVLAPTPSGSLTVNIYYYKRPEPLVKQQGRITSIDTSNNYIIVDDIGSSVSTSTTGFGSYLNIIDYQTGEVKRTLQVSALDTTSEQITFKSSGLTRSTVLGRTVSTSIGSDAAVDDYVCLVTGSCISEIDDAYVDYIMQHTVVALKRRIGEPVTDELISLKDMEKELLKSWSGRESGNAFRRLSRSWRRNFLSYRRGVY